MPSLLGLDSGLTVTKAVLFDVDGTTLATARRQVEQLIPEPCHVERDMDALWMATAQAIADVLAQCGRASSDVRAIGATAHGDGLYVLDENQRPLGHGIVSLDSRAGDRVSSWDGDGVSAQALARTGQAPHVSAPSTLLAWIKEHEPGRFARIRHILSCKDWLRFCLTGLVGTDCTEASTSFCDVQTQRYGDGILEMFGLGELAGALVPVDACDAIVGTVSAQAADQTGLAPGTPVVAGLHDVTASALGAGGHREGIVDIVAGTYSINEAVSSAPCTDQRWLCRNAITPGKWNNMAISPASSANYEWFLETLCASERQSIEARGGSIHEALLSEAEAALAQPTHLLFHPYLFGSPHGPQASAGFIGLRGWHTRGDMLRAVLEGIAFNHRVHIDALREGFAPHQARMSGGISRSALFGQLMADVLGMPVNVPDADEAAAWGAALCAGSGVGVFASPFDDPRDVQNTETVFTPDAQAHEKLDARYRLHCAYADHMSEFWKRLDGYAS